MSELDDVQIIQIENASGGLSPSEVCDYLRIDYDGLSDAGKKQFDMAYRYAQAQMKVQAVNMLKTAMVGKQGMEASLAVLTRFGEKWPKQEGENAPGGVKRAFRVIFDGEE